MRHRLQAQPYRRGGTRQQGPALAAMMRGRAAQGQHPMDTRRALQRTAKQRQKPRGGGRFKSEAQREFMFAHGLLAAHKWAHGERTTPADWRPGSLSARLRKRAVRGRA